MPGLWVPCKICYRSSPEDYPWGADLKKSAPTLVFSGIYSMENVYGWSKRDQHINRSNYLRKLRMSVVDDLSVP